LNVFAFCFFGQDPDPFQALRGRYGRGAGSLEHRHAANVRKFRMGGKKDLDFSKRLLLAEDEMVTTTETALIIATEMDTFVALVPFIIQQISEHICQSILERKNDAHHDALELELMGIIDDLCSMFNDAGERYNPGDHDYDLVDAMITEQVNRFRRTSKTVLDNMINDNGLDDTNNDWRVFVSAYIPGAITDDMIEATAGANTVHHDMMLLLEEQGKGGDGVKTPDTIVGQLLYLLVKFFFAPILGVLLWLIRTPYESYCILCRYASEEEMPICHLAKTNDEFCKYATPTRN
jgi:hypothetical protein